MFHESFGMPNDDSQYQLQREARERRMIRGQLRCERLGTIDVLIRNVSSHGLGATCRCLPPMPGEAVMVRMPDAQVISGTVRWVEDQSFGIVLDEPFDIAALNSALQQMKAIAEKNARWEVKGKHKVSTWQPDQNALRRI